MSEQKELTDIEAQELKEMVAASKKRIAAMGDDEVENSIINDDHCCAGESVSLDSD